MDQEQLIRQIMEAVMKDLGKEQVSFAKKEPAPSRASAGSGTSRATVADYPLAEKHPGEVRAVSGKTLDDLSYADLASGKLDGKDFRITQRTLELQAQIAEDAGRAPLARNFRRAAELTAVPDERLLEIYNALRPYRSTKDELIAIAEELEGKYEASISGAWVREAADVYERRDRLRRD